MKLTVANPSPRRSKYRKYGGKKARRVRRKSSTVRRRRNPSSRKTLVDNVIGSTKNAAIGAGGALAMDVVLAKLPMIPQDFKDGPMAPITKGAVAIGIGMAVAKFGKMKNVGLQMAQGGMTIAMHDFAKTAVLGPMGLSGYEELMGLGIYDNDMDYADMGGYEEMGYYSPGATLSGDEAF